MRNVFLGIILLLSFAVHSQKPIGEDPPFVQVISRVTKKAIMLRWAVTTPVAWKRANKYGFTIERKTIVRAGEILKNEEVKKITPTPMLPKPLAAWEEFAGKNDYAAIAAQAIYGDGFDVELSEGGTDIMGIVNLSQALEQRFSFALYAADQDFEVATYSGLAYVDTDVKSGEKYLYTIKTAIPEEKMVVAQGGVYLGLSDYIELPKPRDFVGIFKDKSVLLSWNFTSLADFYNSYIIERSEDNGTTFNPVSDIPVINMGEKEEKTTDRMFYIDSLPQNNKEYQYRIKGISPFGEKSPSSKIVSGVAKKAMLYNPAIKKAELQPDNSTAVITWEFPQEGLESLSHFELNRSDTAKDRYQVVVPNISKTTRSLKFKNLNAINYFKITAVGVDGTKRMSFPQMVQPIDDTPPATPFGLTGVVDSTGVVQLQWNANAEPDFLGYRVFRANIENEEFTQITFSTIPQNRITDTVNIKTLNSKIYYKVQAFDNRYNPSGFSDVVMLKKPDLIPPTKPVFTSFAADDGVIALEWITSSSADAVKTLVYRKEKGKKIPWQLLAETDFPQNQFKDATAVPALTYLYTLVTVDESGLESEPVTPLTISLPDNKSKPEIDRFAAVVNREEKHITLHWKYKAQPVKEFLLYKAEEGKQPTRYKVFSNTKNRFVDHQLTVNTKYTYLLQAVFDSRAKSPIKKIEVEY
jgi:fibronectin type 3 domain-containing protein